MRGRGGGKEDGEEGEGEEERGFVQWIGMGDENWVFYCPGFVSSVIWGIYLSHLCLRFPIHEMGQVGYVNFQLPLSFNLLHSSFRKQEEGFPGGAVVENLPANAGDTGSSPGLGRSHMPRSG